MNKKIIENPFLVHNTLITLLIIRYCTRYFFLFLKRNGIHMQVQEYKTIHAPVEGEYKEKGSKFLAFAYPVNSEDEVKMLLEDLKKRHHTARHHCWAYRLLPDGSKYRAYDDGEPSNSAGKPILGQIESFGLTQTCVIVVRYFGGTLLGVGGLMHAYKEAAKNALLSAHVISKHVESKLRIVCDFKAVNVVITACKQYQGSIITQDFSERCNIVCSIPLQFHQQFMHSINQTQIHAEQL